MRVTVHGAGGGEVTGSAYLIQTPEANILVDRGMFQGPRQVENYNNFPKRGAFQKLDASVRSSENDSSCAWIIRAIERRSSCDISATRVEKDS
jgi:metallo-beta-lactamase family protein